MLTEQRDGYGRLCALAARQHEMIDRNDPETLLTVLTERQRIVNALASGNVALGPYLADWPRTLESLPNAARAQVERLLDDIRATAAAVMQRDREDSAMLAARKQLLGQAVSGMGGAVTANAAYARGSAAAEGNESTDLTG
jgi:hypothetical protein